jgi:hypothetical protein
MGGGGGPARAPTPKGKGTSDGTRKGKSDTAAGSIAGYLSARFQGSCTYSVNSVMKRAKTSMSYRGHCQSR